MYCIHKKWCRLKNEQDKKGPQAKDLIAKMKDTKIKYNILIINNKLTKMVDHFKNLGGADIITTFKMTHGLNFGPITDSIISQIKQSVKRNNSNNTS